MSFADNAVAAFLGGLNCSQAVLSAYADSVGLERDIALRIAGGFGAGMGRMQETCGAVTGAVMVIGMKLIDKNTGPEQLRGRVYDAVQEFFKKFKERNGTADCGELLGCDLRTPEGRGVFGEKGMMTTVCAKCVRDAAIVLDEILSENKGV